jgi:hypothetical protein
MPGTVTTGRDACPRQAYHLHPEPQPSARSAPLDPWTPNPTNVQTSNPQRSSAENYEAFWRRVKEEDTEREREWRRTRGLGADVGADLHVVGGRGRRASARGARRSRLGCEGRRNGATCFFSSAFIFRSRVGVGSRGWDREGEGAYGHLDAASGGAADGHVEEADGVGHVRRVS